MKLCKRRTLRQKKKPKKEVYKLKVLIACEESQTVCKAFRERGHEAFEGIAAAMGEQWG